MRPLILGEEQKETLLKLKQNAESNPLSFDDLLDIYNGHQPMVGDREGFSCIIPVGYRVCLSIEDQPKKDGSGFMKTRHMSVSVATEGKLPNPEACKMIMSELGFKKELHECIVDFDTESKRAISIIEL